MSPSPRLDVRLRRFLVVGVAVMLLAACHSGGGHPAASASGTTAVPTTDKKGNPVVSLSVRLGALQIQAATQPRPFSPVVANQILSLVNGYIAAGITGPLFTGKAAASLAPYFAPSLTARLQPGARDRQALTDEHVPAITEVTKTLDQPLTLVGLEDQTGRLIMVGASLGVRVQGTTAQGPLTVNRAGDLLLEPNASNQWRVTGYTVEVTRVAAGTTTTTRATTTTAAP